MRHGSLFNGIGGFQLAAQWMGWQNIFSCEIDKFCNQVTKKHFPDSIQHEDIRTTDFTIYRNRIDIVTGGFPCQPFSMAGKRKGTEDDRHLWPEMLRAIREIQPRYVVGENVRGLTNWNGGMVFDQVQADLEAEGFEIIPVLLPACAVDAPHRRDRVWIIANSKGGGNRGELRRLESKNGGEWQSQKCREDNNEPGNDGAERDAANTESNRINRAPELENNKGQGGERRGCDADNACEISDKDRRNNVANSGQSGLQIVSRGEQSSVYAETGTQSRSEFGGTLTEAEWWSDFPTQSPICGRNDGLPNRVDRIKSLGNAIVPQVALQIFKAINATA